MRRKIPVASFIVLALCVSCFLLVRAQGPTASITVRSESDRDPVQVTRLFLGDQQLTSGEDFPIGPDWVRDLKFEVKNVSSQNIKMVWLSLFLKGTPPNNSMKLDFILGKNHWDGKNRYFTDDFTLHPGETAMVGSNPDLYEGFKKALDSQNLSRSPQVFSQMTEPIAL